MPFVYSRLSKIGKSFTHINDQLSEPLSNAPILNDTKIPGMYVHHGGGLFNIEFIQQTKKLIKWFSKRQFTKGLLFRKERGELQNSKILKISIVYIKMLL